MVQNLAVPAANKRACGTRVKALPQQPGSLVDERLQAHRLSSGHRIGDEGL